VGKRNKGNQKIARGRGNQGDWAGANSRPRYGEKSEHKDWNDKIRSKNRDKGKIA
jgi:hypothetical protein